MEGPWQSQGRQSLPGSVTQSSGNHKLIRRRPDCEPQKFSFSLSSEPQKEMKQEVNCLLKGLRETGGGCRDPKQKPNQKGHGPEVGRQVGAERMLKGFLEDKRKP